MKIFHIPIESYNNRYTADWVEQFEREFKNNDVDFVTIGDTTLRKIEDGDVLDATGTHVYKFNQLTELMKLIKAGEVKDDDVIFFADLWCPGIESLFYVRDVMGLKFKIAGILHAGTWDPFDFTCRYGMRQWGQYIELGWLQAIDIIFVATKFHKDLIVFNSGNLDHYFDPSKIVVTGIPFYSDLLREKYPVTEKENIIVFPHRVAPEKNPKRFDRLAKKLKKEFPDWKFIKTMEVTKSRDEYFKLLSRSKVMISYADQETFGFSTVEAMALGNYVIVPNRLSYRETVPKQYRYDNDKKVEEMLRDFMQRTEIPEYPDLQQWSRAVNKMILVMKYI